MPNWYSPLFNPNRGNIDLYSEFCFMFWFSSGKATKKCGVLAPWTGLNLHSLHWKAALTTGPPEKFLSAEVPSHQSKLETGPHSRRWADEASSAAPSRVWTISLPSAVREKIAFHETSSCCQKSWGSLP